MAKATAVVPPKVPAATQVATTVPEVKPARKADAQSSLDSAIPDLSSLLQSGDLVTAFENYTLPDDLAQIPPERIVEVEEINCAPFVSNPQVQPRLQIISQMLDTFKGQAPTLNDAGDRATYQLPGLGSGTNTLLLPKS